MMFLPGRFGVHISVRVNLVPTISRFSICCEPFSDLEYIVSITKLSHQIVGWSIVWIPNCLDCNQECARAVTYNKLNAARCCQSYNLFSGISTYGKCRYQSSICWAIEASGLHVGNNLLGGI